MTQLGYDRYYRELNAQTTRLAETIRAADPDRRVPTCPEWTLAELAQHVGRAHRWASAIVTRRARTVVRSAEVADREIPADAAERSAWLIGGATRLVGAIRDAGPRTPVWTWAGDGTAGFWARRMLHETVVHRADAELALGREFELAADLAADGISEWLDILGLAKGAAAVELHGEGETLHFHATDDGLGDTGEWLVRRTPTGLVTEPGHAKADAAVRARAADLFLMLMRRIPADDPRVELHGDRKLVEHWLEHTAF